VNDWLEQAAGRLAAAVGDEAASYELSRDDVDALLDLARIAAHESGARVTAPLACYLLGLAGGRHADWSIEDLAAAMAPDAGSADV
jgi:hypothetical protein